MGFARVGVAVLLAGVLMVSAGCTPGAPSEVPPADPTPSTSPVPATAAPSPSATPTADATSAPPSVIGETATFLSVVDGDTVETSAGTVRLIGIDTPERGECGSDEAAATIWRVVGSGDVVMLELPAGQNDQDHYGRLIRFVTTSEGVDLSLLQIESGNAIARYDSTDGYPKHPREAAYHAAQLATRSDFGRVVTVACAADASAPAPIAPPSSDDPWWMQYPSCAQLKRNTAGHPTGPFDRDDPADAAIYDWFAHGTGNRGDGDGDGLACE